MHCPSGGDSRKLFDGIDSDDEKIKLLAKGGFINTPDFKPKTVGAGFSWNSEGQLWNFVYGDITEQFAVVLYKDKAEFWNGYYDYVNTPGFDKDSKQIVYK